MISAVIPHPPRWLAARLAVCGMLAAAALVLIGGGDVLTAWKAARGLPGGTELLDRCLRSGVLLVIAIATAASAGFTITWLARLAGEWATTLVGILGRALALFPAAALAWSFVGWWIGVRGWPVETLMPMQLDVAVQDWRLSFGSMLWEYFAPALVLAVPLLGEITGSPQVPLRARMQSLCLFAPAWLIIIEDVLHFMGWGGWMAQEIRAGSMENVAAGLAAGGWLSAVLCLLCTGMPTRKKEDASRFVGVCWLPWPLWALAALVLPVKPAASWALLWFALLVAGMAGWYRALRQMPRGAVPGLRWFFAWCFEVGAGMLLWGAAACAMKPVLAHELGSYAAQLCRPLAMTSLEASAQSLADPAQLLRAGSLIMLAALFFSQTSRILRPCPPSPSSTSAT